MVLGLFWAGLGCLIGLSAARAKGLGTAAGLIGGFLLGPLAVLMFLCDGHLKRCPSCSKWIDKSAIICCYCGRELVKREPLFVQVREPDTEKKAIEEKRVEEESDKETSEKKKCPFCGEMILAEAVKCRFCGTFIGAVKELPQVPCVTIDQAYLTLGGQEVYLLCPFCHVKFTAEVEFSGEPFECSECQGQFTFLLQGKKGQA